ncbi:MAG TPA: OsmC family protein [Longimicrobiales bacterium]|nr:OsmC family protein [Longimicrobiales bacterium]
MSIRNAQARWEGDLKAGKGIMRLGSGAYEGQYSYRSRFEDGPGTNPEELIGAAHAGCFSMAFSNLLAQAGHRPRRVETRARVHFGPVDGKPTISRIELDTEGDVPGIDAARFRELAEEAKAGCPVSRALAGVQIDLQARLVGG